MREESITVDLNFTWYTGGVRGKSIVVKDSAKPTRSSRTGSNLRGGAQASLVAATWIGIIITLHGYKDSNNFTFVKHEAML